MCRIKLLLLLSIYLLYNCTSIQKKHVDAIYFNGTVYTVDSLFSTHEAFAIKDGKFIEVGSTIAIQKKYAAKKIPEI